MTDIDPLITAHADAARQSRQRSHGCIREAAAAIARADGCPMLHGAFDGVSVALAQLTQAAPHSAAAANSAANAELAAEIDGVDGDGTFRALARALANEAADIARAADEAEQVVEQVVSTLELYAGSDAADVDDDSAHQADECARLIHNLAATIAALHGGRMTAAAPTRCAADATTAREYAWAAYWAAGHAADLIREAQYVAERALTEVWASPVAAASDRDATAAGLVRSAHRALTAACMAEDAAARAAAVPPASPEAAATVWVVRAAAALTRATTQTAQAAAGAAHAGRPNVVLSGARTGLDGA